MSVISRRGLQFLLHYLLSDIWQTLSTLLPRRWWFRWFRGAGRVNTPFGCGTSQTCSLSQAQSSMWVCVFQFMCLITVMEGCKKKYIIISTLVKVQIWQKLPSSTNLFRKFVGIIIFSTPWPQLCCSIFLVTCKTFVMSCIISLYQTEKCYAQCNKSHPINDWQLSRKCQSELCFDGLTAAIQGCFTMQ